MYVPCVYAMGFVPPVNMNWSDFYAEYQELGTRGGTLTMTGNLSLTNGEYALYNTQKPVTIDANGYAIIIGSTAKLTIDAENLSIYSNKSKINFGIFTVSAGTLKLVNCNIKTTNRAAIESISYPTILDFSKAANVNIDTTFTMSDEEYGDQSRFGIYYSGDQLDIKNLNLTVTGGDNAIRSRGSIHLQESNITFHGKSTDKAIQLLDDIYELKQDSQSKVFPFQSSIIIPEVPDIPEVPEIPEIPDVPYNILYEPGDITIKSIVGMRKNELQFPRTTNIAYKTASGYEHIEGVAVDWNTKTLPSVLREGTYFVQGTLDPNSLIEYHIKNPNNIRPTITLIVDAEGAITGLTAELERINGKDVVIFNNLPNLDGATAIYAEFSRDDVDYKRTKVNIAPNNLIPEYTENLVDLYSHTNYELRVPYPRENPFYVRLNIEGSGFQGMTNHIQLIADDHTGDKGGGGQGEHDRPDKPDPTIPVNPVNPVNPVKPENPGEAIKPVVPSRPNPLPEPTAPKEPIPDRPILTEQIDTKPEKPETIEISDEVTQVTEKIDTDTPKIIKLASQGETSNKLLETESTLYIKKPPMPAYIPVVFATIFLIGIGFVLGEKMKNR